MKNSANMPMLFQFFICLIINFVVCSGLPTAAQQSNCLAVHSDQSNVKYLVGTQKVNWFQAFAVCKQVGMELASITSREEETLVENALTDLEDKAGHGTGYWLAGGYGSTASDFIWLTTGDPVIYRKFASGQPNSSARCLVIYLQTTNLFGWYNLDCAQLRGFICQTPRTTM